MILYFIWFVLTSSTKIKKYKLNLSLKYWLICINLLFSSGFHIETRLLFNLKLYRVKSWWMMTFFFSVQWFNAEEKNCWKWQGEDWNCHSRAGREKEGSSATGLGTSELMLLFLYLFIRSKYLFLWYFYLIKIFIFIFLFDQNIYFYDIFIWSKKFCHWKYNQNAS